MNKNLYLSKGSNDVLNSELSALIEEYKRKSSSTGCHYFDYVNLYKNIRSFRFKEVYEAGTGVSTLVIAYALYKNYSDFGIVGKVTSMEELPKYHKMAVNLIPDFLRNYVDIKLSKTTFDYYGIFRGIRYKDIPDNPYDFCWIDGPKYSLSNDKGFYCFDFDILYLIKNSKVPVYGFIDNRISTVYVLQQIFGLSKVKYYKIEDTGVGVINGVENKELIGYRSYVSNNKGKVSIYRSSNPERHAKKIIRRRNLKKR